MLIRPNLNQTFFVKNPEKKELILNYLCPKCGSKIREFDFKDLTAKKEYSISGLCQKCQDQKI